MFSDYSDSSDNFNPSDYSDKISSGSIGIAPFWVQTNAEVRTAHVCASCTLLPCSIDETNAAVNESPAPTVSATSTFGVGWNDTCPGVNT